MGRSPELSKELHRLIWDLWVYKSMNSRQIADHINNDVQYKSKFGEIQPVGVMYHINQIREEMEGMINEDALDTYVGDFIRTKEQFDVEVEDIDKMIEYENKQTPINNDLVLKLRKLKHDIRVDRMKLLQDVELPIRVKKMKLERKKYADRLELVQKAEVIDERVSESRDNQDSS